MTANAQPDEKTAALSKECIAAGASIRKLAAVRLPGRGMGVIATEAISEDETLIEIPPSLLIYPEMLPTAFASRFPNLTVHGLLAAALAAPDAVNHDWSSWKAVMNTPDEFRASIPLLWPPAVQELLTWASKSHLDKQKKKVDSDWAIVSKALPHIDQETYLHNWLLVNTRTFYFNSPLAKQKRDSADCLAMCPYVDLINHSDNGCKVSFTAAGYTVQSQQPYAPGEEITFTYGGHSNDFLLTEYGFILEQNKYDFIRIDPYILSLLDDARTDLLQENGFLGNYSLDVSGVCHRTEVALRTLILSRNIWHDFRNGERDGSQEQGSVDLLVTRVMENIRDDASKKQSELIRLKQDLDGLDIEAADLALARWEQIQKVVDIVEKSLHT